MINNIFPEYSHEKWIKPGSELLDIVKFDQIYRIFNGAEPVLTPLGNEYAHESERLIQMIITDLMAGAVEKSRISAPLLYAFQKDVFDSTGDPFPGIWTDILASDPFVTVKTTGKFNSQPYGPEDELFSFAFVTLSSLVRSVNEFATSKLSEFIVEESDAHPFHELLAMSYEQLPAEKKVVVQALSGMHHSGIVLPLEFVSGVISPIEYAKGLVALKIIGQHAAPGILLDLLHAGDYLGCLAQRQEGGRQAASMMKEGETDTVEFKSTFRWDIRAGKTNPAVERASLKTMAAFLNSSGGTLLIGVRDDGSIEGIETDKFANDDKFLLHLWTLIRTCLGREVSPYIRTVLEKMDDKTVCLVHCKQSIRPVFLRQPGFDEAYYIRIGPSSNAMDISEALKYISDHFTGR
jgi:hypothetical protein